ncbi:Protein STRICTOSIDINE SYNTHASE-LIKE 4 [Bienertia sinuspersici]
MDSKPFFIYFLVGCLVALALHIYFFSTISPQILEVPSPFLVNSLIPPNTRLQEVTKLGEGHLKNPEDICVDKNGILYTATRDGWIRRLQKNGSVFENWKWINSSTMLGMTTIAAGGLVICDAEKGLLKVDEDGITTLVSHFNGSTLWFADDVIEGEDGSLYFTLASTKYGLHNWYLDILEAKPHGQLLKFNPQTNETLLLLDNLAFANGVALSSDQQYLLVCETWKYKCLKYWLQGNLQGTTEIFIDNLPGGPDNINLSPDGSYWIALLQLTNKGFEFVHTSKIAKHLVATFPRMLSIILGINKKATVIKVSKDGNILKRFDDPEGTVMSFFDFSCRV